MSHVHFYTPCPYLRKVLAKVHAFIKHSLEAILESNYSIERAHVHANNFKQSLMSSGGYSGELSFLRETKSLIYGEVEYESFSRVLLLAVQVRPCSNPSPTYLPTYLHLYYDLICHQS